MSKRITLRIALALVILIGAMGAWFLFRPHPKSAPTAQTAYVVLGQVKTEKLPNQVSSSGTLEASEQAKISPQINGYIAKILFEEGDTVRQGDVLVQLDDRAERTAYLSAKAQADLTHLQFQRNQRLLKRGLITQAVYYQSKLNDETSQAALKTAETNLANTTLRAPFSGTMGETSINVGDFVTAGASIALLTNTRTLRAHYTLPSEYLSKVQLGQSVTLTNPAYPEKTFQGKVNYIAPTVNTDSQNIILHAAVDNPSGLLKAGLYAQVHQTLGPDQSVLMIPANSLLTSMKGYYVYTIQNGKAKKVTVETGKRLANQIAITRGLKLGEKIVVAGQDKLNPGQTVQVTQ